MRMRQYRVPGHSPGKSPAEGANTQFIWYYFRPGQGGSTEANIARWQGQFASADNAPVVAQVDRFQAQSGGMSVTTVELRGDDARVVGMGPVGTARPDQILLAAGE